MAKVDSTNQTMSKKQERLYIQQLGEIYEDELKVRAWLNRSTLSLQAKSDLSTFLNMRRDDTKEKLQIMANKRGISYEELRKAITDGTAEKLVEEDSE
jgi:hypothetical protein